ncbi:MAG: hypothetical protein ACW990_19275, partial [Promethearchaeota archaeon]
QESTEVYNKQLQDLGAADFIKSNQMWMAPRKKGMKSVTYNEIEQGKLEEALAYLANFMGGFNVIEGYGYKFDIMVSQQEMLAAQQAAQS